MAHDPEDDWFPQSDPSPSAGERGLPLEDEWLVDSEPSRRTPPVDLWALADKRVLIPAALAVAFLVAVLAALGVFSGGSPAPAPPVTTTTTTPAPVTSTTTTTTTPVAAAVTPPSMTLKPGDIGPEVTLLQKELSSLGYPVGKADGDYGAATTKAVSAFQRARGMKVDGIVGPKTLRALSP